MTPGRAAAVDARRGAAVDARPELVPITVPPRRRTAADELDAARFAAASADALAGSLNLRRTLARVVDLAVPRFGRWAGVLLLADRTLRRVGTSAADGGPARTSDTTARRSRLDPAVVELIAALAAAPPQQVLAGADVLAALGVPADELPADGERVVVTTVGLAVHAVGAGLLAVAGPEDAVPDLEEVVALARRATGAVTTALVHEERTTLATTLRAALVPAALPEVPGVQLGASYRPALEATQIGGDFYDVTPVADGLWTFSIGDVCGKGVEAAVLTGQVRQSVRTADRVTTEPADVLRLVNDTLLTGDGSTFVTLLHGTIRPDADGVTLRFAGGGHPPPLLLRGGTVEETASKGTLVGMLEDVAFRTVEVRLEPGDVLLAFTDGAPEAHGDTGLLGTEALADLLADSGDLTAQAVTERLMQRVLEHVGDRAHDDVAFLALRATPRADA